MIPSSNNMLEQIRPLVQQILDENNVDFEYLAIDEDMTLDYVITSSLELIDAVPEDNKDIQLRAILCAVILENLVLHAKSLSTKK